MTLHFFVRILKCRREHQENNMDEQAVEQTSEKKVKLFSKEWFYTTSESVHAQLWLVILGFTESSVFLVPPDPLLAAMVFLHERKWWRFTVITASASIAGAVFGYIVGALLYSTVGVHIIELYSLQSAMDKATQLVREGVFAFTLTMAFTPIPFKVAVLAAGFTKAPFLPFFVAAAVGRFARYIFVAFVAKTFGENSGRITGRVLRYSAIIGMVLIIGYGVYLFIK